MTQQSSLDRRNVLAGMAGVGAVLVASEALAQGKKEEPKAAPHKHEKDAGPPTAISPTLQAVIDAANSSLAAGRVCLARCTDHLAAGMASMGDCQRAVMNMLAVTEAVAATSAYRNSAAKAHKALVSVCAEYCRACAVECEKHGAMHPEHKVCGEACRACIKACDAYAAEK